MHPWFAWYGLDATVLQSVLAIRLKTIKFVGALYPRNSASSNLSKENDQTSIRDIWSKMFITI